MAEWIEHDGGACPVNENTDLVYRVAGEMRDEAEEWARQFGTSKASDADWSEVREYRITNPAAALPPPG